MQSKVLLLFAFAALSGVGLGLRREVDGDRETPALEKQEKQQKEQRHRLQRRVKSNLEGSEAADAAENLTKLEKKEKRHRLQRHVKSNLEGSEAADAAENLTKLEKKEKRHKPQKRTKSKQEVSKAPEAAENPVNEEKQEGKKGGVMQALRNFFAEETTTAEPTWHGLPMYFQNNTPTEFFTIFSDDQRKDFGSRLFRWNLEEEERRRLHRCRGPRKGEKVVYFMQHAFPVPKQDDAPLAEPGKIEALNVRYDPMMRKAVLDPVQRPQVILTSPARKAMESAVWAFADVFPDVPYEVNTDIRGLGGIEGIAMPRSTSKGLYNMAVNSSRNFKVASSLLKQYRALPTDWDRDSKPHMDRWFDFMDGLQKRPEQRFIVISHGSMIRQANVTKTGYGQISIRALQPDKTWRRLTPPDCWNATA